MPLELAAAQPWLAAFTAGTPTSCRCGPLPLNCFCCGKRLTVGAMATLAWPCPVFSRNQHAHGKRGHGAQPFRNRSYLECRADKLAVRGASTTGKGVQRCVFRSSPPRALFIAVVG